MYLMLAATYLWDLYGSSIAVTNRSLDHSLSTRLIPAGAFKGWCAGDLLSRSLFTHLIAPYKCTVQTGS